MAKSKIIAIRVPENSNLLARLKKVSDKTKLSYAEILEQAVTQAELETETSVSKASTSLQSQIKELADRITALENAGKQPEKKKAPSKLPTSTKAKRAAAAKTERSYEKAEEYIYDLFRKGVNQFQIARKLNEEQWPTRTGQGKWYQATVKRILDRNKTATQNTQNTQKRSRKRS
jgi:hypothetical protein